MTYSNQQLREMQDRRINQLRRRNTTIAKIGVGWNTYLQIDHQSFCVVEQTTKKRAKWFAKMLAVALERLIEGNK